ncbi:hypothetical protein G6F58_012935 [Rhizopus delemar]|nr:hypothetical protein G6F58_012935 [Rhizopus delemar]
MFFTTTCCWPTSSSTSSAIFWPSPSPTTTSDSLPGQWQDQGFTGHRHGHAIKDGQGQRQRTEQHQQGIKGGLADIGPLARIQVAEEAAGSGDDHRRSSSTCTPAATNAACAADWSPPTRATTSWPYGVSLIRSMRPDRML